MKYPFARWLPKFMSLGDKTGSQLLAPEVSAWNEAPTKAAPEKQAPRPQTPSLTVSKFSVPDLVVGVPGTVRPEPTPAEPVRQERMPAWLPKFMSLGGKTESQLPAPDVSAWSEAPTKAAPKIPAPPPQMPSLTVSEFFVPDLAVGVPGTVRPKPEPAEEAIHELRPVEPVGAKRRPIEEVMPSSTVFAKPRRKMHAEDESAPKPATMRVRERRKAELESLSLDQIPQPSLICDFMTRSGTRGAWWSR